MTRRRLISGLLALHLGVVAFHLLPLPHEWTRPAHIYVRLLGVKQNWQLFAPSALREFVDVEVVAFYPEPADTGAPTETRTGSRAEPPAAEAHAWVAVNHHLLGDTTPLLPHLANHRGGPLLSRTIWYEAYAPYRRVLAREVCAALPTRDGMAPGGITLTGISWTVAVPWEDGPPAPEYRTELGGYPC